MATERVNDRSPSRSTKHTVDPSSSADPSDLPTLRHNFWGGIAVTPNSLSEFEQILTRFVSDNGKDGLEITEQIIVVEGDSAPRQMNRVSELCQLRNPKVDSINRVYMSFQSAERDAHLWFDALGTFDRYAAVLKVSAQSPDHVSTVHSDVRREMRNIRTLYSPLRIMVDWVFTTMSRVPSVVWFIVIVLPAALYLLFVLAAILYLGWNWINTDSVPTPASGPPVVAPEEIPEAIIGTSRDPSEKTQGGDVGVELDHSRRESYRPAGNWVQWLMMIFALITGVAIPYIFRILFPRVVFEIGEGVDRSKIITWYRRSLLISLFLGAILIPVLREWLMEKIA